MSLEGQTAEVQKRGLQLRLLNEVSTRLQGLLVSEHFYQQIVDIIQKKLQLHAIHIWSVGSDQSATLQAQAGAYSDHLRYGHTIKPGEGIIGKVLLTHKSYLSNDVSKDPNFTNLELPVNTLSELTIPVIRDGEVIAILNAENDHINAFNEDDVITLEAVASQISVAMANRESFAEVRDFNQRLQSAVDEKTLELRKAHERILDQQKLLQRENRALKNLVNQDQKLDTIGQSSAILSVLSMVDKIAPTTATVLIQGESGTGKELVARRLHFKSERVNAPYVTVNCGALQESLLESELFGHEKGSFTGAVTQKIGLCEMAEGGTLFLDEIGELSLGIQAKLLRFLQEGEFYRIGGKRSIKVDVRVISATNRDLEVEVREGRFREDLYYRLNTITLRVPPLRKRKEDLPALVDYFLKSSKVGGTIAIKKVDPAVYEILANYDWPGNIRELQNTVERMKILAENHELRVEDVPFNIRMPKSSKKDGAEYSIEMPLDAVEKNHILRTLTFHHGNKTKTANSLGITIKTLYNKLHRYGVIQNEMTSSAE